MSADQTTPAEVRCATCHWWQFARITSNLRLDGRCNCPGWPEHVVSRDGVKADDFCANHQERADA